MSRIGKRPIDIPEKTTVEINGNTVVVRGPHGEISRSFAGKEVSIRLEEKTVVLEKKKDTKMGRALWGTYASHIRNMVQGVNEPYRKRLQLEGIGYRVAKEGNELVLSVGFSHQVRVAIPEGIEVVVEKNIITVSGINKEYVGQFAAKVRAVKKPEPYKGKGLRYEGEHVRIKQGKRAMA
jgi:large subunit ribosomal protein L6